MSLERILVVDDDKLIQQVLSGLLRRKRLTVTSAFTIAEAEGFIANDTFDMVVLDMRLPDGDGHALLERVIALPDQPLVVMMTGYGTIESAVSCMRGGAFDYIIKPFSTGQIEVVLRKAENYRQLLRVNRYFSRAEEDGGDLLGRSPAMQRLRQLIERVAPTDATVLITGENGTGKEMIARELWRHSPRANEPYIKVNCAALSETLIESELFGHEKGAFTGAGERREGRFELANKGTLLLDEVSEIPANLQAKLLRVLQEREFERVGGTKTIKVNVRILATSNRDLLHFVERGHFRSDLYYRLNVFPVHVPPLRERPEDLQMLTEAFLQRFARKHGLKIPGFSDQAIAAITSYPWPGNVRELQNTVERAVILSENGRPIGVPALGLPTLSRAIVGQQIPPAHSAPPTAQTAPFESRPASMWIPAPTPTPASSETPPVSTQENSFSTPDEQLIEIPSAPPAVDDTPEIIPLELLEQRAILNALEVTGGNRTKAAEMLGIAIRTLRNKLNEYRQRGVALAADSSDSE